MHYIYTHIVLVRNANLSGSVQYGLTGDQKLAGLIPAESGNSLSWRLIVKCFYSHSLPSVDSRWAVVSFRQKNVHKYWLTA